VYRNVNAQIKHLLDGAEAVAFAGGKERCFAILARIALSKLGKTIAHLVSQIDVRTGSECDYATSRGSSSAGPFPVLSGRYCVKTLPGLWDI
jgi:hypothetical protein